MLSKSLVRSSGEVGLQQILTGNVITCLEPLLLIIVSAISSSGVVLLHLKEMFLGLKSVIVTEINIKKVQKQDFKNIKNVTGCRDGMPKSMQTR